MPKMNGSQMALGIREEKPDPPLLLCTGYSAAMASKKLSISHSTATIQKPLRRETLSKAVRKLLDGEPVNERELE